MKTLYLLRHAKAEPGGKETSDPERRLASRGREACQAMGEYMKAKKYLPGFALSSPSARTRETLALVTQAAGISPRAQFDNVFYLASAEEITRQIQAADDAVSALMVVGHNPGMHHVALDLSNARRTQARTDLELKYPTCALAVLRFGAERWREIAPGLGELVEFITPGEM